MGRGLAAGTLFLLIGCFIAYQCATTNVYLDTRVLIGGYALRFDAGGRLAFTAGASSASVLFFFALGYGSSAMAKVFARPVAWRWIDRSIAVMMFGFAAGLLLPLM